MFGYLEDGILHEADRTQEQAAGGAGRRWCPSRQAWPPRRDHHRNQPRLPARRGNGGNGSVRCFQGAFLCGGSLRWVVALCCRCCRCCRATATSVCWRIERERRKQQARGPPQPSHRGQPTGAPAQDGKARSRNFPRPPGSAGRSRRTRRRHQAPRNPPRDGCWRTGPGGRDQPPPWLPGATDGNHL